MLSFFFLLTSGDLSARICESTGDGNWVHASTWSCTGTPIAGDTVIIQAGHTVLLSNNLQFTGSPMHIMVYGTWEFDGGGSKLSLPCGSYVETFEGGVLLPDPAYQGFSETIRICGVTYWNTTDGPQEGYFIWPGPLVPLPVELLSFQAIQNGVPIQLDWSTASETDVVAFEIFRSIDAMNSVSIGVYQAAGNNFGIQQYRSSDLPPTSGSYYYHLHELGNDGLRKEIAVTSVQFNYSNGILNCSPNPLMKEEILTVQLPELHGSIDIRLIGLDGRWSHPLSMESDGSLMVVLDGLPIEAGMQMVQVIEGDRIVGTCRFLLQ